MSATCTPFSWLRLERLRLGELPAVEATTIEAHVAGCDACRAGLDRIRADEGRRLRPLPARPVVVAGPRRTPWLGFGFATLAAGALAALLLTWRGGLEERAAFPPARVRAKGGVVAVDLVRERDGAVGLDPARFGESDRFKVLATCPPGAARWDVAVFQPGEVSFPLAGGALACGNRVALPGAFRLSGGAPVHVCVLVGARAPDRAALRARGAAALGETAACARLDR